MHILALTTATPRFDACLFDAATDAVIAETNYEDEMAHAERSLIAIDEMFTRAGLTPAWLEAIACDVGPGSFTGVRAGLAAAKGIALARDIPLVGISSLDAMAAAHASVFPSAGRVACVLDAKRRERFVAFYEGEPSLASAAAIAVVPEALVLREIGDATLVDALPEARWIARLAARRMTLGALPTLDEVEPVYAREPDAKRPTQLPKLSRA